jgi:hypothetical protein
MILGVFQNVLDWTAIGTLTLALATTVALLIGWLTLRQTKSEIELSRREVEEAHRPVLVPLADSRNVDVSSAAGRKPPSAQPTLQRVGRLAVPIENIGTGPALRIEATLSLLNEDGGPSAAGTGGVTPAFVAGLKASGNVVPVIQVPGLIGVPGFWLTLTYEDVARKGWITKARYIASRNRYEDLTINTLDEGAYGLQQNSELVKSTA